MSVSRASREPLSDAHVRLGVLMRAARQAAKVTTRSVDGYTSGHISNVENGYVSPSAELVDQYISAFGGDPARLRAAYSDAKNESELRRRRQRGKASLNEKPSKRITVDSPVSEILACYHADQREDYFRIDERGVVTEMTSITTLTPRSEDVWLFFNNFSYFADKRRGVLTAEGGMGCEVVKIDETDTGLIRIFLNIENAVRYGPNSRTFTYKVRVKSDEPVTPILWHQETEGASSYSIRVQFTPPYLPEKIWRFRGSSTFNAEIEPEADSVFPASSNGMYFWDFHDLRAEYAGLVWRWQA